MISDQRINTRVIGVDIDVVETEIAIVGIRGDIIAKDSIRTSDYAEPNSFAMALAEHAIMLAEANGGYENIRSMGVSAPSANYMTGCIENAANLPWKGVVPLAAMLRDRLGLAVGVANDAHTAALGEKEYGSAHGMQDFVVITISHGGLGSCMFCDTHVYLGNNGFAGEFGHTCVEIDGRPCGCGRRGCLETYVSGRGVMETAQEMLADNAVASMLRDTDLSPQAITKCCEQGDAVAIEVMRKTGEILGTALANYSSIINPEAFILTGEMTKVGQWMLEPAQKAFNENVFHNTCGKVKLLVSILDDNERDVLGASALAWDLKEYSLFK